MQIKLVSKAIRFLIENDENFKLELQRAVISEVTKKTLLKDAKSIFNEVSKEEISSICKESEIGKTMIDTAKRTLATIIEPKYWSSKVYYLTKEKQDEIRKRVEFSVKEEFDNLFQDSIKKACDNTIENLNSVIERKVNKAIDESIKKRVDSEIQKKLDKLSSM